MIFTKIANIEKVEESVIKELLNKEFVILDGAMGTMLQSSGLKLGERPELLNFSNARLIQNVHEKYLEAGADIIYANTFGANRHKLEGFGYSVSEVIEAGIYNAKTACKEHNAYVALDVGPIGELLEPSGILLFEEAYEIFSEIVVAGEKAGADLIVFETMTDLYEVKAAVLAAKENTNLPIFVTMTFEENGRTFTGCGIENMALTLQGLGVDAIGMNCSLGPVEIVPLIQKLASFTDLPLIAKPNAGLPDPETGGYNITAEEFGIIMSQYADAGVKILGGCCGTTQFYIEALKENLVNKTCRERVFQRKTKFCTATDVVEVDTVRVIGERINPTGKKRFADALKNHDISYVLTQAIEQVEAGADILDVNVGVPQLNESSLMVEIVKAIQSVVSVPLQIDSSKYEALEAGLRVYNGKPILNSVNGEADKLNQILPLAKKYGAAVVCLTMDEDGIPHTAEKRIEIATKIMNKAIEYGIPREDVLVDCLTLTVSAQQKDCFETLKAMAVIKEKLGLELVLGVSNISFGLPNRNLINHSFLTLAMSHGLTLPILNPNSKSMMDAVYAYKVLSAYDLDSECYIEKYKDIGKDANIVSLPTEEPTIEEAIIKGLGDRVRRMTEELLQWKEPLEVVNTVLIPTLDFVGKKYEEGEFFLPQLIRSASACCSAFDVIKERILKTNQKSISKGKIILATVKGDIHDIGKNIVKVILENYGYEIIDLGRDVAPELVLETAIKHQVKLIGLSALMTTTVESMKDTISLVKASGYHCEIMVGGAVLTEEYSKKIGADYYAKDAQKSVEIAKKILG
ncbi:MAG: homocysteine S-methyltransferase family protein [Eubacteriales bacterium]